MRLLFEFSFASIIWSAADSRVGQRSARFAQPGQVQAMRLLFEEIGAILERGMAAGELRDDVRPSLAATLFIGSLDILVTSRVLGTGERPEDESARHAYDLASATETVELFLNGCARGGSTR